ncbi:MAG: nuclear transport factor 2 family protein [Actinomycetota bacterium]
MPGPAAATVSRFGAVEDDQRYTRLVEVFADDAVYYDPLFGPQRGKDAIHAFMTHMEEVVPASGARFASWEAFGDDDCGFARWDMVAPGADGVEVAVPGQSLYRLRDGLVTGVVDYFDPQVYRRLRGEDAPRPNFVDAGGALRDDAATGGPALELVRRFWEIQDSGRYTDLVELFADDAVFTDLNIGRMEGRDEIADLMARMETEMPGRGITFELVDAAGDETVAWSQWTCRYADGGSFPGWTLHTVRDGRFTLDADHYDTVLAAELRNR